MKFTKRAVSPVIAVVLIISMTVATTGLVWVMISNLTDTSGDNNLKADGGKFSDTDGDGKYDEFRVTVYNSGLNALDMNKLVMIDRSTGDIYSWNYTFHAILNPAESVDLIAFAQVVTNQLNGGKAYRVSFNIKANNAETEILYSESMYLAPMLEGEYIGAKLQYKSASQEYSSFKSTFPTDGYLPTLLFVLGKFSGTSVDGDYILQNTKNIKEGDYRPSFSDTFNFTSGIGSETNQKFAPYNDSGNYPGLVDYVNRFDTKDSLGWNPKGVAYLGAYIYNPETTSMDVNVYFQGDDYTKLYIEGTLEGTGNQWSKWWGPVSYTLNPGYTYMLLKTADRGGGFNGQIMIRDTGAVDNVQNLESRWLSNPTTPNNIYTGPSTGMAYRASSGPGGTFSNGWPGEGYSPTKFYLLGQFQNTKLKASEMYTDYIAKSHSSFDELTYRPYNNSGDTFSEPKLDNSTGGTFIPYVDQGVYPGLIDFRGSHFDTLDTTLNWNDKGLVYVGFYIENPGSTNATVNLHVQADDHFLLYFEGNLIEDHVNKGWNKWGQTNVVSLKPGTNYFMIKVGDGGGGWDLNVLFRDPSGKVDVSLLKNSFLSSAPLLTTQSINQFSVVPKQVETFSTQWSIGQTVLNQSQSQSVILNVTDSNGNPVANATVELISDAGLWNSSGDARTVLTTSPTGIVKDNLTFAFDYMYSNSAEIFITAHIAKSNFTDLEDHISFTLNRFPTLVEYSFLAGDQSIELGEITSISLQVLKDGLPESGVQVRIETPVGEFVNGKKFAIGRTNAEGIFSIVWNSADVQTFVKNTDLVFYASLNDSSYEGLINQVERDLVLITPGFTTSDVSNVSGDLQQLGQIQIKGDSSGNFPLFLATTISVSLMIGVLLGIFLGRKVGRR